MVVNRDTEPLFRNLPKSLLEFQAAATPSWVCSFLELSVRVTRRLTCAVWALVTFLLHLPITTSLYLYLPDLGWEMEIIAIIMIRKGKAER